MELRIFKGIVKVMKFYINKELADEWKERDRW